MCLSLIDLDDQDDRTWFATLYYASSFHLAYFRQRTNTEGVSPERASREASTALEDDNAEMIITLFLLGRAQPDPFRLNVSPYQVRKVDWRVSEKVGQGRNRTRKS